MKNKRGTDSEAALEIKVKRIRVHPPIAKSENYPQLTLTVIHALEKQNPPDREKIEWKLITNLPVESLSEAVEKLNWYAMRWKIETFHKILKSGCKAEDSKLRTSERIANLISVFCIVSWRIFWMTMIQRTAPTTPSSAAFTKLECNLLDELVKNKDKAPASPLEPTISHYLSKLARLGGYLARTNDPPPGNIVMWRGLSRLTDIHLGFLLGRKLVGN